MSNETTVEGLVEKREGQRGQKQVDLRNAEAAKKAAEAEEAKKPQKFVNPGPGFRTDTVIHSRVKLGQRLFLFLASCLRGIADWADGTAAERRKANLEHDRYLKENREHQEHVDKMVSMFSSLEDDRFLNTCWNMIDKTRPGNFRAERGETKVQAIKRIIDSELERFYLSEPKDSEILVVGLGRYEEEDAKETQVREPDPEPCSRSKHCDSLHEKAGCGNACGKNDPPKKVPDPFLDAMLRKRLGVLMQEKDPSQKEKDEIEYILMQLDDSIIVEGAEKTPILKEDHEHWDGTKKPKTVVSKAVVTADQVRQMPLGKSKDLLEFLNREGYGSFVSELRYALEQKVCLPEEPIHEPSDDVKRQSELFPKEKSE